MQKDANDALCFVEAARICAMSAAMFLGSRHDRESSSYRATKIA